MRQRAGVLRVMGPLPFVRLLPSRVGFAERDASRPAFGGRSLVSLTKHTCVGRGPIGPRLSVRPSVRHVQKRARPHRLSGFATLTVKV